MRVREGSEQRRKNQRQVECGGKTKRECVKSLFVPCDSCDSVLCIVSRQCAMIIVMRCVDNSRAGDYKMMPLCNHTHTFKYNLVKHTRFILIFVSSVLNCNSVNEIMEQLETSDCCCKFRNQAPVFIYTFSEKGLHF